MSIGYTANKEMVSKAVQYNKPKYIPTSAISPYVRPSDWLSLPSVTTSDQKFVGLIAVYNDDTNWVALSATTSTGTYTVDWGDGVVETFASNTVANHAYTYSSISSGTLSTRGYRQAIATVTATTGNLTSINIQQKYSGGYPGTWATGSARWLDIKFGSPNMTTFTISNNSPSVYFPLLEQIEVVNLSGTSTSFFNTFRNLYKLQNLIWPSTISITGGTQAFGSCFALKNAPSLNFSGAFTSAGMFDQCRSLTYVPVYDFSNCSSADLTSMFSNCFALKTISGLISGGKITNTTTMFSNAYSLVTIPTFDTSNVTSMNAMFSGCVSLTSAPYLNTSSVTNFVSMFDGCYSLISVPAYNTASATNTASMFNNCRALVSLPDFNTINVSNTASMFSSCSSLVVSPTLNTSNVTVAPNMFNGCVALLQAPSFNLSNLANMNAMFNNCASITSIPAYNLGNVTDFGSAFGSCGNIKSVTIDLPKATNMLSAFNGCTSLETATVSNTGNVTNMSSMFASNQNLRVAPSLDTTKVTTISAMYSSCPVLESIPNYDLSNATTIGSFAANGWEVTVFDSTNIRASLTLTNNKFTKSGIEKIMGNLRANTTATITVTGTPGADTPITQNATANTASNVLVMANTVGVTVGQQVTAAGKINGAVNATLSANKVTVATYIDNNSMVAFPTVTTSNLAIKTLYYVSNRASSGGGNWQYDLSTTVGGNTITFTNGTGTMAVNVLVTAVNTNANVIINATSSDNITTLSTTFRSLNTNIATYKGWTVTG